VASGERKTRRIAICQTDQYAGPGSTVCIHCLRGTQRRPRQPCQCYDSTRVSSAVQISARVVAWRCSLATFVQSQENFLRVAVISEGIHEMNIFLAFDWDSQAGAAKSESCIFEGRPCMLDPMILLTLKGTKGSPSLSGYIAA
jgi:hypothetical protein